MVRLPVLTVELPDWLKVPRPKLPTTREWVVPSNVPTLTVAKSVMLARELLAELLSPMLREPATLRVPVELTVRWPSWLTRSPKPLLEVGPEAPTLKEPVVI